MGQGQGCVEMNRLIIIVFLSLFCVLLSAAEPQSFSYEVSLAGEVSAAIYDGDGRIVRTLLRGDHHEAGTHHIAWDGLNRFGVPQPAGTYTWRVLWKPPFKAQYLAMLGAGHPQHPPSDNWVGNHDGPGAIAMDAGGITIGAGTTENVNTLIQTSLDGSSIEWVVYGREHWLKGRWQGTSSLATSGNGTLFMLQQNGYVHALDAATGDRRSTWDLLPKGVKRDNQLYGRYTGARLAAHGDALVISYEALNRICWIDTKDGSIQTQITIDTPLDIAFGPNGELFTIADRSILVADQSGKTRTVLESSPHLEAPSRLTVGDNGDLLVFDAATKQVKRFDRNGTFMQSYGREGGRQTGLYVDTDFVEVTDIEADGQGGFLVAEPTGLPRRVARFGADGKVIDRWYGGETYWNWGVADPRNPEHVWLNEGDKGEWLVLVAIDYTSGHWRVLETHAIKGRAEGLVWSGAGGFDGRIHVLYRGDQRYLAFDSSMPILFLHDEQSHSLEPIVVGGIGTRQGLETAQRLAGKTETKLSTWLWTDLNGDHLPQPAEFRFDLESAAYNRTSSGGVGEDFSYLNAVTPSNTLQLLRRVVERWTDNGVPIYSLRDQKIADVAKWVERLPDQNLEKGNFYKNSGLLAGREGSFYVMGNVHPPEHGDRFPTNRSAQNRIAKFEPDGQLEWKIGRHATRKFGSPAGHMHQLVGFLGEAHDCIVVGDRAGQPAEAYTRDGLYAGDFLASRVDDGMPDSVYTYMNGPRGGILNGDCLATSSVITLPDGDVIWFAPGQGSTPVYRISGWQGWQRQNGTLILETPTPSATGEGSGLTGVYFTNHDLSGDPLLTRIDTRIWMSLDEVFPQRVGGSRVLDAVHQTRPTYAWPRDLPVSLVPDSFSARWTGEVEALLSEPFTFSIYMRGNARLWIDGKLVIDGWETTRSKILMSEPIDLLVGQKVAVRLEYRSSTPLPNLSLNWESTSLERERIPSDNLFPMK